MTGDVPAGAPRKHPFISVRGLASAITHPGMIVILWAGVAVHTVLLSSLIADRANRPDFSHYYASAMLLRQNADPYTTNLKPIAAKLGLDLEVIDQGSQTPTFLLCFEPLTMLRLRPAYWTWFGLNLLALGAAFFLLLGRNSGLDAPAAWVVAALTLLYPPLGIHFYYAQSQILILLLLVLMMRLLEVRRDAAAGWVLAFAGLLKVFPLVMGGYLLVRKRWRALVYTGVSFAAGGILTLALVGVQNSFHFIYAIGFVTSAEFIARPANIALGSFISRLFWYIFGLQPGFTLDLIRRIACWSAELTLLALTIKATLWTPHSDEGELRTFALWIPTMIMISPTAWLHYLILLVIPFVALARESGCGQASERAIWAGIGSYLLISLATALSPLLKHLGVPWLYRMAEECGFISLALAYLSAYWLATERGGEPVLSAGRGARRMA